MNLYKFYSDTCQPCKALTEVLDELGVEHTAINIKDDMDTAIKYQVRNVPVLIDLDSDERLIGFSSKPKLEAWLGSLN